MLDYAVCEISGKQYKITPNQAVEVDFLEGVSQDVEAKLLLFSEGGKVKIGTPYLKDKLILKFLDIVKKDKIRVAKFHAKANYRRVVGNRTKKTRLVWSVKKS